MKAKAVIFGCSGTVLLDEEREFFQKTQPWGFILFARNLQSEAQTRNLISDLKACLDHQGHVFIDEEGGRVSRLRALGGWIGPPAADFRKNSTDTVHCVQAIRSNYRAIGARLADLGFTADCAPVLDVPVKNADPIIGDRAFSPCHNEIAPLAQACLDGLMDANIAGVIKHIPGHGRADVDSHKSLPVVNTAHPKLSASDFLPFKALNQAKMAMSAHVVYSDIDPDAPATTSRTIVHEIIRKEIGFEGLLMSDDLDMKALQGTLVERAEQTIAAGCDMLLHCSANLTAMHELASVTPLLQGRALDRANKAAPMQKTAALDASIAIKQAKVSFEAL